MPNQKITYLLLTFCLSFVLGTASSYSQCDSSVPNFIVDLSTNKDSAWSSPSVYRAGNCCSTTAPDVCVSFTLTLSPDAQGIIFEVCDGAMPSGSLFYQVNCGAVQSVGEMLCLSGTGPFEITFCKPGNNQNKYCITSISKPEAGVDLSVTDGCIDTLTASGFADTSIVWTSVYPGNIGDYDSLLSCTEDCDTTIVRGSSNVPTYIDYQVCGYPIGGCGLALICDTIRVTFYKTLFVDILPQNPTICFGSSGIQLTADPVGGKPPYSYKWSTGATTQSVNVGVGTYIVELSDESGCPPAYDTVSVTAFANTIQADAGEDTVLCSQSSIAELNGSVIAASGGVWLGGDGTFSPDSNTLNAFYTPTAAEISAGFLDLILLTTGNGSCPADRDTVRLIFSEFSASISISPDSVSCIGGSDGSAQVFATGSNAPYTYQWDANAGNVTTAMATNLSVGTYYVTISDFLGCDSVVSVIVGEPDSLTSIISSNIPASCFNGNDGQATVLPSGGTSPYTYLWSNSQTSATASSLAAGSYRVTITDANGCINYDSTTISQPTQLNFSQTAGTDASCYLGSDGSASITGLGGTPPYTYAWSNSQTGPTATSLAAGTYTATITDSNGCIVVDTVLIGQPTILISSTTITQNALCAGSNTGTASASASGATAPYTYAWSNSQIGATATALSAGVYYVTVSDSNMCSIVDSVIITEPDSLKSSFSAVINVSCFGGSDGSAQVSMTGGTPPYSYMWSNNQQTATATNLSAGTYTVIITDSNFCSHRDTIIITEPSALSSTISSNMPVSCYGGNDGSASVGASGATPPYTYLWSNSQTTSTVNNLAAGTYYVTITDSNLCTKIDSTTIDQPTQLASSFTVVSNVSCFGGNDGSATVGASGGITPYSYSWSNSQTSATATGLSMGTYYVSITDSNNCVLVDTVTISEPTVLSSTTSVISDALCAGTATGSAEVIPSGGTAPYTYLWSNSQTGSTASNLTKGTYYVTVTDTNSCTIVDTVSISEPDSLQNTFSAHQNVSCYGGSDGSATASMTGGTQPYSYLWSNNQQSAAASGLKAGKYYISITDNNNCVFLDSVVITQPDSLVIDFSPVVDASCLDFKDGSATANPSGGVPPYTYQWSVNQTTQQATGLSANTYFVTVTDANGCRSISSVVIDEPTALELDLSSNSLDTICVNDNIILTATASGGNGTYTYTWNNNLGNGSVKSLSPTKSNRYVVSVTDQNNCPIAMDSMDIVVRNLFDDSISVVVTDEICRGKSAILQGYHQGSYPPYTYSWNIPLSGLGPHTVSPSVNTTYTLEVRDVCNNLITADASVIVNVPPSINLKDTIAKGCSPLTVTFDNNTGKDVSYNWRFGDGSISTLSKPVHTYINSSNTLPMTYLVNLEIVSPAGCTTKTSAGHKVIVWPTPDASFIASPEESTLEFPTIKFSSGLKDANDWMWSFGDGDSSDIGSPFDETKIPHTYGDTGTYLVKLWKSNRYGCRDTAEKTVFIGPTYTVGIPNAFTPDPNGPSGGHYNPNSLNNNIFFPFTQYVKEFHMLIFNRWGEIVFESNDHNIGWDGYYKDKICQQDVYVYRIEILYTDGERVVKVGDVTLLR